MAIFNSYVSLPDGSPLIIDGEIGVLRAELQSLLGH